MRLPWLLALLPSLAWAGTITYDVTLPTKNTDGSNVTATGATSLASLRVEYGTCNAGAFGMKTGEFSSTTLTSPVTSVTSPNLAAGTYCARVYVKNAGGQESAPTNVVQGDVPVPTPNPGTLAVKQITAYKMRQSVDTYAFVPIGTVPLGTACDAAHTVDGRYPVPRAKVTLTSRFDTMPLIVFADCG